MKYSDIKPITIANYHVDVPWTLIEGWLDSSRECLEVNLEPDFQRAHVWDDPQRSSYVEWLLKGGKSAREIYWNCPGWMKLASKEGPLELVDGLQRLTAVQKFLNNEIPVFSGHYKDDFDTEPRSTQCSLKFYVNDLESRADVLQWYLDINAGGIAHTSDELDRVRKLLEAEKNG